MLQPQSNNPYRLSMTPAQPAGEDAAPSSDMPSSTQSYVSPPPAQPQQTIQLRFQSQPTTPTTPTTPGAPTQSPPAISLPADGPSGKENSYKRESIVITIHPTASNVSVGNDMSPTPTYPNRCSVANSMRANRQSMQVSSNECTMWPAHRLKDKERRYKKRRWMWVKIGAAAICVVGAAALGLGIGKAVNDHNKSQST